MIELCDGLGRKIEDITTVCSAKGFSFGLLQAASFTATAPSDHAKIAGIHSDGLPYLTEGDRVIKAYRFENGVKRLRFCGRVWAVDDVGDDSDNKTTFVAYDPLRMGAARLVRSETALSDTWEAFNSVIYDQVKGSHIARWLLTSTNQERGHCGLESGFKTYRRTVLELDPTDYWLLDTLSVSYLNSIAGAQHSLNFFDLGGAPARTAKGLLAGDPNLALNLTGGDLWYVDAIPPVITGDVFTLSGIIAPAGNATYGILDQAGGAGGVGGPKILRFNSGGGRVLQLRRSDDSVVVDSSVAVPESVATHFVITKNGGAVHIYLDGVDRTGTVTDHPMNSGLNGRFTLFSAASAFPFQGVADEFAVWDGVALTPAQVTTLYNASIGTPLPDYGNVFEDDDSPRSVQYEGRFIDSAIIELAASSGGFDFNVVPLDRTDGILARLDIVGMRGVERPNVRFGYGVPPFNVKHIERHKNMEGVVNDLWGQAAPAFGLEQAQYRRVADAVSKARFGTMEGFEVFPDITDLGLLDALLGEEIAFRDRAREIVQWSVMQGEPPYYWDDFEVGDIVTIAATPKLRGGLVGQQRVYQADVVVDNEGGEFLNSVTTIPT
jgi:hypothetical protein